MARTMIQDWLSQTYQDRSPNSSSRYLLNGYLQSTEGEGKAQVELIGTPGTSVFTKSLGIPSAVDAIQGNGLTPNLVAIQTTIPHGLEVGQGFVLQNTTSYNQTGLVVNSVLSTTTFTYLTQANTSSDLEQSGLIRPSGESPITDVAPESSCRGIYTTSTGRVFAAYAQYLFEIFDTGAWSIVTDIGIGSGSNVSMADDGFSLILVDGSIMVQVDLATNVVTPITTLDFLQPTEVVFLNGRIVCINADIENNNANKFYFCELFDATDWDSLNYASAESSADIINAIEVREGQLWLFGPRSYEVWGIDDNPELPYAKVGGSSTEIGCGAKNSPANIGGQVFWLGSSTAGDNVVYMSEGYGAKRISTHAIEYALGQIGTGTSDAIGFAYQQEGHTFYILTLIEGNRTFAYDVTNGKWAERSSRDAVANRALYWEILFTTFAFGRILCGGLNNARVLTLDLDKYTEWDGRPIVRMLRGPIIFQNLGMLFHYRFQVDMETGTGLQAGEPFESGIQTGEAEDPLLMMRYSNDGGHTWSSQRTTPIGKVGQYLSRVFFNRLGRSRQRVYEISMSAPVKWHILGARITAKSGGQP